MRPGTKGFALAACALVLAGCESGNLNPRVGVILSDEGIPIVVGIPCPETGPTTVSLLRSEDQSIGDGNDEVLWKVETDSPSIPLIVEVGTSPAGFVESVPLDSAIPTGEELVAYVEWDGYGNAMGFVERDLNSDTLLDAEGLTWDLAEFVADRQERYCS
jgi:hypothetical protein